MEREFHRLLLGLWLAGSMACAPEIVRGQEAEPGEGEPPAAEVPADQPAPLPVDPKRSPLAFEPKSPDELFDATVMMVDVARFDLAKLYLGRLMEETLDDDTLMALRDKYGAAAFVKLTNIPELSAPAIKLLDLSNAAAIKQANDPVRIARLIDQLEGDPEPRAEAEAELESLGTAVVPGLLAVLHNAEQLPRHESAMQAILRIGAPVVPQLVGALNAPGDMFRADVLSMLGTLNATAAVPYLWYPSLSQDESAAIRTAAAQALRQILGVPGPTGAGRVVIEGTVERMLKSVREHFRNQYAWKTDDAGKVTLWSWSEKAGTIVARIVPPDQASDLIGLRFAREALALAPDLRATQVWYLCLALAGDIRRSGFDNPLPTGPGTAHDLALSVGADVALDVLTEAFHSTRPAVAVAALRVFSQIGTLDQMNLGGGQRSVITAALDYPDQRVQFAAATAILQIDPKTPFRGAPRVVEILKRSLASEGRPHAVVGEISAQRGAMIGGFALAAAPAQYRVTGVKTFQVGPSGIVYEKDLGPDTLKVFETMDRYNPDKTWKATNDDWPEEQEEPTE
jgi:HEAT repeat protein